MRRRSLTFAACVAVASVSCALFPSLGDLRGGSIDGGQVDGAATDASPGPFCATADAAFCDDFDEDDGSFSRWSGRNVPDGATLGLAASDASPPNAAHFDIVAGAVGCSLVKTLLAAPPSSLRYSYDLFVERLDNVGFNLSPIKPTGLSKGGVLFLDVKIAPSFLEQLVTADGGLRIVEHPLAQPIPIGRWTKIEILVSFSAMTAQVTVDGTPALAPTALDPALQYGVPQVAAGVSYVGPTGDGVKIAIDDVLVETF